MQKQQLALILTLAATALFLLSAQDSARSSQELFNEWRSQYGSMLKLTPEEETFRFKIFEKNLQEINEHNAKEGQSYKMGVNQFTAFTQSEFELSYLQKFEARSPQPEGVLEKLELSIDWVSYGAVSPVKNQGSCTATYAFSTIGGIEGISKIFYKTETEYSVQQLVDCSQSYGNSGCNSGNMVNSYQFITAKGTPAFT
jgi:C1A family cysteine protease